MNLRLIAPTDAAWPDDSALIEDQEMSVRSFNCLRGANLVTVGEVRQMSDKQLLRLPNFGKLSLSEVRGLLGPGPLPTPKPIPPHERYVRNLLRGADQDRTLSIVINRLYGGTFAQVGEAHGIGGPRARQICRHVARDLQALKERDTTEPLAS